MKMIWCWRCKKEVAMLEPHEWEEIAAMGEIYRKGHREAENKLQYSIENKETFWQQRLEKFREISGDPNACSEGKCVIDKHRTDVVGPPCRNCGKPLRTPTASFCAECGVERR